MVFSPFPIEESDVLRLNEPYQLTVQEIMERPPFLHAYVAAGQQGLQRPVRWVHIIEVIHFEELLQGGEMILTTGAAFKTDTALFASYIGQLVKRDVACLCIEMGHYISSVPEAWIEMAESYGLPLIIFPQAVRFIDITQDIHAHLINQHHHALRQLEQISREFHRMTLTSQGVAQVLQLLQTSTGAQVIYCPLDGQPQFVPHVSGVQGKRWQQRLKDLLPVGEQDGSAPALIEAPDQTFIVQPIGAMGKTWAHLVLALSRKPRQQDYLILDSASLSIAQDLLRKRYIEERQLYSQTLWVDDLLHLRIRDEEQIKALVGTGFKRFNETSYRVCLIELQQQGHETGSAAAPSLGGASGLGFGFKDDDDSTGIHLSLTIRSVFKQQTFHPLITLQNNRLVVIAFDLTPAKPAKDRLQRVFQTLQELSDSGNAPPFVIGVGQPNTGFANAYISYQEAIQASSLSATLQAKCLYFDELGVFRLLFHITDKGMLESFVQSCLGPLIDHDRTRSSELLRTLKVYLDHDGSKQIAAKRLFIVRQSLYYRLDQIAELLGEDYMSPEKRLSLQVALRAYQLLNPDSKL